MTRTAIRPAQAAPWLTPLARWLRRKRWAANVARCDRIRSGLSFSRRLIFDDEVRPFLDDGTRIAYPDAHPLNRLTALYPVAGLTGGMPRSSRIGSRVREVEGTCKDSLRMV